MARFRIIKYGNGWIECLTNFGETCRWKNTEDFIKTVNYPKNQWFKDCLRDAIEIDWKLPEDDKNKIVEAILSDPDD